MSRHTLIEYALASRSGSAFARREGMEVLIHLLLVLIIVGVIVYVVQVLLPMPPAIRYAIELIVAVMLLWYLLQLLGFNLGLPR